MQLSRRNRATLVAAARTLIPTGGTLPWGADDLDVAQIAEADIRSWPSHVRARVRAFCTAFELLPFACGFRRPFTRLSPADQHATLERAAVAGGIRGLFVGLMRQLCYTVYLQTPEVEEAVGYRYTCLRPREGVDAAPADQVHH